jgi:hypothetical protein
VLRRVSLRMCTHKTHRTCTVPNTAEALTNFTTTTEEKREAGRGKGERAMRGRKQGRESGWKGGSERGSEGAKGLPDDLQGTLKQANTRG